MEEIRKRNIMINKAGGTAGKGSVNYRISLPNPWVEKIGVSEEDREVNIMFKDNKIIIKKERLEMLKLIVKDHGKEEVLKEGTFEEILEHLKENENIINWVLDEDPEMELPNLEEIEDLSDLENEFRKIDLSWWSLEIEEM